MTELLPSLVGLAIGAGYGLMFALAAAGRTRGAPTRLDALAQAAWALLGLVIAHRLVSWPLVPAWLWMLPVALAAAGAALLVLRWRALPGLPEARGGRIAGRLQIGGTVAVSAALVLL